MKLACVLVVALVAMPSLVLAKDDRVRDPLATPGIDQRQVNQQRRIDQGVRSGALTEREALKLERGQEHVARVEERVKADGQVTVRERERVQHAQDVQSRRIYREKHDRQHDFDRDGRNDRQERREKRRER